MKVYYYTLILVALSACSSKKNASTDTSKAAEDAVEVMSEAQSRLIVSFYSPGNGIDHKALALFSTEILSKNKNITYSTVSWGREGERDYCFPLAELSAEEQVAFIEEVNTLLGSVKRVHILQNQECRQSK
ncbi:MAG: LmbE family N-acetylglucosaminyl deacetylase [Bacteroidia bacterium]|jgi:LmbE family N-acetylglucosaminyl deacetylase